MSASEKLPPPGELARLINLVRQSQAPEPEPPPGDRPPPPAPANQPYLIVGLGNPGKEYARNRHNIGFMVVDKFAARLGASFSRVQSRALVTDARFEGRKVILAKPQTYMNESGQAVAALVNFYKIPLPHLLIAFDDMDLPLGALRLRPKGGSGGQKGMKSIIARLGTREDFPRLRIGIGRPPGRLPPPDYLLQDFAAAEQDALAPALDRAVDAIQTFLKEGLEKAMNVYNPA